MKTDDELISALRGWAGQMTMPGRRALVNEAADPIEELSERIAIMAADMDKTWGESYCTASGAAVYPDDGPE